jgi:hypothetical protein
MVGLPIRVEPEGFSALNEIYELLPISIRPTVDREAGTATTGLSPWMGDPSRLYMLAVLGLKHGLGAAHMIPSH